MDIENKNEVNRTKENPQENGTPVVSTENNGNENGDSRPQLKKEKSTRTGSTKNLDEKKQKELEMAKEYQKVTRSLAREISKKDGFSLVTQTEEKKVEEVIPEEPAPAPPVEEPADGLLTETTFKSATILLLAMEIAIILLFGLCTRTAITDENTGHFVDVYQMWTGIEIMMFFGFGYLMTFLKRYGMGAVGFTMLITVLALQWGVLVEGFFDKWYNNEWGYIEVDLLALIDGLFLVAALLISYGAVIGKVSPLQLVIMTFFEVIFYSINKCVLVWGLVDLVDAGGTVNIHMFGAYFGLAVAYMIGKPTASTETEGGHIADLFSLIGTIFLWIYWPSFNGGALPPNSAQQQRAIINTIFSLCGATIASFIASSWLNHNWKLRPVDIQNATLAGGVAIGAICHLTLNISHCLLIGFAAGVASTYGFARIQAKLDTWGLHDTCGVNNLHGIPSLIGGIASVILVAYKGYHDRDLPDVITEHDQWKDQWAAIMMTLALAIPSGLVVGFIMSLFHPNSGTQFYADAPYWEVMDDFGRSHESEIQKNLNDLEAGLEASRSLRAIIAKYATLGFQPGGLDFSIHSKRSGRPDNASSDHGSVLSGSENDSRSDV